MPEPDRPSVPPSYGIKPASEGRLVAWEDVVAKLKAARNYCIATASGAGRPHASPVWGIWHEQTFVFSTDPKSRKGRNLAESSQIVVHLESGDDVVIIEGTARALTPEQVTPEMDAAYTRKYGFSLGDGTVFQVIPGRAFAWAESDDPESATRWRF